LWVGRERIGGRRQHSDDRFVGPDFHLLHDLRSVHVGAYGIQSDTRLCFPHLGLEKCSDESDRHLAECSTLLFFADEFDGVSDLGEMTFQGSL
jgi:hypothetical protein